MIKVINKNQLKYYSKSNITRHCWQIYYFPTTCLGTTSENKKKELDAHTVRYWIHKSLEFLQTSPYFNTDTDRAGLNRKKSKNKNFFLPTGYQRRDIAWRQNCGAFIIFFSQILYEIQFSTLGCKVHFWVKLFILNPVVK